MPKYDFSIVYRRLVAPLVTWVLRISGIAFTILLAFLVYLGMKYHVRFPSRRNDPYENVCRIRQLMRIHIGFKLLDFLRWKYIDLLYAAKSRQEFKEYGLTLYCGKQGSGKTISMVRYANWVHEQYPDCIIITNFKYRYANANMLNWRALMDVRNGVKGVLFLIDEIHSEYSSESWKDFPEALLSEISQQRKQRIKICASSQEFMRVVKQLREQAFSVMQCVTYFGRWTFNKEYDAKDFEIYGNSASKDKKLRTIWKSSFVQSNDLRHCYDTFERIQRMAKVSFIPRNERAG